MSPAAWLTIWALVILTVAFFTIRAWRAGRRGVGDFDKMRHSAHQEAGMRRDGSGPNSSTPLGGF